MVYFLFRGGADGARPWFRSGELEKLSERCGQQIRNFDCEVGCAFVQFMGGRRIRRHGAR